MKDTPSDSVLIFIKVLELTYKGENFDKIKKDFDLFI